MTYNDYRKALLDTYYRRQLQDAIDAYRPGQPTVILLPGGMGSELHRSDNAYPTVAPDQFSDVAWASLNLVLRSSGTWLTIDRQGEDDGAYVIAADGPISFMSETPYDDFATFCQNKSWNYVVFGFDWRRPVDESAARFRTFLAAFAQGIEAHHGNPLPATTIVCHSMGGLVATLAMRDPATAALPFKSLLTVATPFYGTWSQQERFYVGFDLLNSLYQRDLVVDIISSLPGPYSLMFLPKEIYDKDGAALGLTRYPMRDAATDAEADPYDPAMAGRWPKSIDRAAIAANKALLMEIAQPLLPALAPRFFNLRAPKASWPVELKWRDVDGATYDTAADDNPITPGPSGPSDGTVPAWSAWHAHTLPDNRRDLQRATDHGTLFEHPEVRNAIATLVTTGRLPDQRTLARSRLPVTPAPALSPEAARQAMRSAAATLRAGAMLPAVFQDKATRRAVMHQLVRW